VRVATDGDTLIIRVNVAYTGLHGGSGRLALTISVPPEVRRVVFGDEQKLIWERSS
jgi:hypothetical protein